MGASELLEFDISLGDEPHAVRPMAKAVIVTESGKRFIDRLAQRKTGVPV
jgi:hypothetical protein